MSDRLGRAQLARAAARFAGPLPALVLMADDARLPDPLAAARALPKGSMVVARSREMLEPLTRALLKARCTVLVAGDQLLAARLGAHGIHLPQARAGEAAHWRARFPDMLITASALSALRSARTRACRDGVPFLSPVCRDRKSPRRARALGAVRANMIWRTRRAYRSMRWAGSMRAMQRG